MLDVQTAVAIHDEIGSLDGKSSTVPTLSAHNLLDNVGIMERKVRKMDGCLDERLEGV
ncbi:MAG: hypothetical protein ACE5KV_06200 [Thermoplasmata archaeon]